MIQLEIDYKSYVKLFIKMECRAPPKPIYMLHKLTPKDSIYWNCIINRVFDIFEDRFEIEVLKIGSLKLKFEI